MSEVKNLIKTYGDFDLHIPRLFLGSEGITLLSGPSGSGKTSVLRHLIGLETCSGMTWEVGGIDLCRLSIRERRLGVVFQNYELFPHRTGKQNIEMALEARKLKVEDVAPIWNLLKDHLELEKFWNRKASLLS
ncbi:MAG: ATP-binding cassette domain-containing protein, partial [Bdellovibrionales bacterium]|nr:ATP-binding cassette domain-containing protein [Bdellovibrionales bacterium]